jgi:hypothetical protein
MLKSLILISFLTLSAFQFLAAQEIKFENTDISYGLVDKGANGERTFRFTNVGSAPLLITDTKASCGCTVPTFPKEAIMPGQSGEIKVIYDTNRTGQFTKQITVSSNALENSSLRLTISGEVKQDPATSTLTPVTTKSNNSNVLIPVTPNQNNNVLTPVIDNK